MADFTWRFDAQYRQAAQASSTINILNQTVNNLTVSTGKAAEGSRRFGRSWTRLASVFNIWNRAVRYAVDDIKKLGRAMTVLFTKVRDVGGSFESAAAQVRGLLSEGADVAIEKAKELGATTMYTATQAASGLIELARAGFTGKEAAEALSPVLAAAQANAISLGAASRIGAVGMNQFRASGEGVKDILEILTAAAKESPTTILALGSAMKNAAPIAALLGMNATKTAAMLAMMAKSGLTAGRSGTMLRTSLERLAKTTPAGEKALARLGINLKRLDLSQPTQWIEVFRKALLKIPKASDQVALLKPIFGRAVTGILPIIQQGGAAFTEMEEKIIRSRQAMEEIKNLMATTLVAAYNRLKSAIESVYVNLVDVIGLPIKEYYNTLATIVGKFSNRIKEVGKLFKSQATDLTSWIAVVKKYGFRGLFAGFGDEIKPELAKLRQLWTALIEGLKATLSEIWKGIFTPEVKQDLIGIGVEVGAAIGEGIKIALQSTEIKEALWSFVETATSPQKLATYLGTQVAKTSTEVAEEVQKVKAKIPPPLPTISPSERRNWREEQDILEEELGYATPADKKLGDYVKQQRQRGKEAREYMKLSPEERRKRGRRAMLSAYKQEAVAESPEALEARKEQLEAQMGLLDQQKQYKQALEESRNVILETKLALIETGKEFAKWLLEPIDRFKKAFADLKQKWGETVQSIKSKALEIGKKFGLVSEGAAKKEEISIAKKSLSITERRLREAQTPEMRMKMRERQAEQLATLSELTGEKGYARQAQQALQTAQRDALEQQKIEMQKVALERKATEESIPLLQKMLGQAETAGGRAAILEKMQSQLMDLGKVPEASKITQDLMISQMKAAEEHSLHLKMTVEHLKTLVELTKQMVSNTGDIVDIGPPYDSEMQAP